MKTQPKYLPLTYSEINANHSSALDLAPNTVARGFANPDPAFNTGMVNGQPVTAFPFPLTEADLQRGQVLFNGICAECHDRAGTGNGVVVQRGFTRPPTFHSDALRSAPVGHFFDVITNGFGTMPTYGPIVQVADRWRIVGYIRALQLSQNASFADVPPDQQSRLGTPPPATATPAGPSATSAAPAAPSGSPVPASTASAAGTQPAGGAAAQGQQLFTSQGCSACHLPNGSGPGPSLVGIYGKPVQLSDGTTVTADDAYLHESIVDPPAKIVKGYQPIMPSFQGRLSEAQISDLIAYIKSLGTQ